VCVSELVLASLGETLISDTPFGHEKFLLAVRAADSSRIRRFREWGGGSVDDEARAQTAIVVIPSNVDSRASTAAPTGWHESSEVGAGHLGWAAKGVVATRAGGSAKEPSNKRDVKPPSSRYFVGRERGM